MAFLRSLFAGVSALRNHQTMMDVIGNNIANVNTVGFKSGRATFSELYAQTLRTASRPTTTVGGTNPMQVGLGMSVNTLDTQFQQGGIERTGGELDLAVSGGAFFIVSAAGQDMYTRAGAFGWDADGRIVTGSGAVLQGKMADATGSIASGTALEDIQVNRDIKSPAVATTFLEFSGNLDASAEVYNPGPPATGGITTATAEAYDSLGNKHSITLTFTKSSTNTWDWSAEIPGTGSVAPTPLGNGTLTFDTQGRMSAPPTGVPITFTPPTGADPLSLDLRFGTVGEFSGVTHTGSSTGSTVKQSDYDGYPSGELLSVAFDSTGKLLGTFSNATVQTLAQVMLAEFNNPGGMMRAGDNLFSLSGNSGTPMLVEPGLSSQLTPGALEQSNVDLADEFTKMITAQRGFQASARVISTSDEFLQEVVNLKR